jgi:hypothetical protein
MDTIQSGTIEQTSRENSESIKAVVNKVIDMGKSIRETDERLRQTEEQVKQLPDLQKNKEAWDQLVKKFDDNVEKQDANLEALKVLIAGQVTEMNKRMSGVEALRLALVNHAQLFEKPLEKSVHYRHFLGKPLLVLLGMGMVLGAVVFFWIRTGVRADQFTGNDSKWRHLKLTHDTAVLKAAERVERDYLADPDAFKKLVDDEEERRAEEIENMMEAEQRRNRADELHKGEKIK